jgi:hypothetical protein
VNTSSSAGPRVRGLDRLSGHDKRIIGQARQLAGMAGPAAVRACYGTTAVSYRDTAHAYAGALSQAAWAIGGNCSPSSGASPTPDRKHCRTARRV